MVSRDQVTPLYHKILSELQEGILEGRFPEGSFLPSELELSRSYGVSRITAKRALDELALAKMAVREQGRGTIVKNATRKRFVAAHVDSLVADLRSAETLNVIKIIFTGEVDASNHVSKLFSIPVHSKLLCVKRVIFGTAGPTSFITSIVRPDVGRKWTKDVLTKRSVTTLIESAGIKLASAEEVITATGADVEAAAHLCVKRRAPVLRVSRTMFDDGGSCVEHAEAIHRSDRYDYRLKLEMA